MHDGSIEQFGTPSEIYEHPSSAWVAEFVGEISEGCNRNVSDDADR